MDIIKFNNPAAPTKMESGEIINGLTSKMWIERYSDAGEFTLVAPASSGIRTKLPIGCFISHTNTEELMIVENHEISDDKDGASQITITGRGFETYLENRIVGSNKTFPDWGTISKYYLARNLTWDQAVLMISDHILVPNLVDPDYLLPYVSVLAAVTGSGTVNARRIERGDLYTRLQELLAIDDLGIKVVRPGTWSPLGEASANTAIVIHRGVDRSDTIIFSYDTGEVVSADYLWSNKQLKNAALITGKWVETTVTTTDIRYARRMMYIDGSGIDGDFNSVPTGTDLTDVIAAMEYLGIEILSSQNDIALTKAEVAEQHSKYRQDFNVGDFITVRGDYNETTVMRVSEYVEIEDEKGEVGYPTLSIV